MISEDTMERIRQHQLWYTTEARMGREIDGCRDFSNANLDGLELMDAWIGSSNFVGSTLRRADLAYSTLAGCDFSGCDMSGLIGPRCNFDEAELERVSLIGGILSKASFRRAKLVKADLSGALLGKATFTDADLTGAILAGCELERAWFERTKVSGAVFSGAEGIDEAFVRSIDVDGVTLDGENAREWLLQAVQTARVADEPRPQAGASI